MRRVLSYVRARIREVLESKPSQYRQGRLDAYEDIQEWIEDELWKEGEEA